MKLAILNPWSAYSKRRKRVLKNRAMSVFYRRQKKYWGSLMTPVLWEIASMYEWERKIEL